MEDNTPSSSLENAPREQLIALLTKSVSRCKSLKQNVTQLTDENTKLTEKNNKFKDAVKELISNRNISNAKINDLELTQRQLEAQVLKLSARSAESNHLEDDNEAAHQRIGSLEALVQKAREKLKSYQTTQRELVAEKQVFEEEIQQLKQRIDRQSAQIDRLSIGGNSGSLSETDVQSIQELKTQMESRKVAYKEKIQEKNREIADLRAQLSEGGLDSWSTALPSVDTDQLLSSVKTGMGSVMDMWSAVKKAASGPEDGNMTAEQITAKIAKIKERESKLLSVKKALEARETAVAEREKRMESYETDTKLSASNADLSGSNMFDIVPTTVNEPSKTDIFDLFDITHAPTPAHVTSNTNDTALQAALDAKTVELASLAEAKAQVDAECVALRAEVESLKQQLTEALQREALADTGLQNRLTQLESELKHAVELRQVSETAAADADAQLANVIADKSSVQAQLDSVLEKTQSLESALATAESRVSECEALLQGNDSNDNIVSELQESLNRCRHELSETERALLDSKSELEETKEKLSGIAVELSTALSAVIVAESIADVLRLDIETLRSEIVNLQNEISRLNTMVEELSENTVSLAEEKSRLYSELTETQQELKTVKADAAKLSEDLVRSQDTITRMVATQEEEGNEDQAQNMLVISLKEDLQNSKNTVIETKLENSRLQSSLDEVKSSLVETQSELSLTQSQLDDTNSELIEVKSQLTESQSELNGVKSELTETKSELSQVQSKLNDTETTLSASQSELTSSKSVVDDLNCRISTMEQELEETRTGLSTASDKDSLLSVKETEISRLTLELSELQSQFDSVRLTLTENQSSGDAESSAMKSTIQDLESKISELETKLSNLESQLLDSQSELTKTQETCMSLQEHVDEKQVQFIHLQSEHATSLAALSTLKQACVAADAEQKADDAELTRERTTSADLAAQVSKLNVQLLAKQQEIDSLADEKTTLTDTTRELHQRVHACVKTLVEIHKRSVLHWTNIHAIDNKATPALTQQLTTAADAGIMSATDLPVCSVSVVDDSDQALIAEDDDGVQRLSLAVVALKSMYKLSSQLSKRVLHAYSLMEISTNVVRDAVDQVGMKSTALTQVLTQSNTEAQKNSNISAEYTAHINRLADELNLLKTEAIEKQRDLKQSQDKVAELERSVSSLVSQSDGVQSEKSSVTAQLGELESKLASTTADLSSANIRITQGIDSLTHTQSQLADATTTIASLESSVAALTRDCNDGWGVGVDVKDTQIIATQVLSNDVYVLIDINSTDVNSEVTYSSQDFTSDSVPALPSTLTPESTPIVLPSYTHTPSPSSFWCSLRVYLTRLLGAVSEVSMRLDSSPTVTYITDDDETISSVVANASQHVAMTLTSGDFTVTVPVCMVYQSVTRTHTAVYTVFASSINNAWEAALEDVRVHSVSSSATLISQVKRLESELDIANSELQTLLEAAGSHSSQRTLVETELAEMRSQLSVLQEQLSVSEETRVDCETRLIVSQTERSTVGNELEEAHNSYNSMLLTEKQTVSSLRQSVQELTASLTSVRNQYDNEHQLRVAKETELASVRNELKNAQTQLESWTGVDMHTHTNAHTSPKPTTTTNTAPDHTELFGTISVDMPWSESTPVTAERRQIGDLESLVTTLESQLSDLRNNEQSLQAQLHSLQSQVTQANECGNNADYLKHVIVKYMQNPGDHDKLFPVIDTLLKLSPQDKDAIVSQRSQKSLFGGWLGR